MTGVPARVDLCFPATPVPGLGADPTPQTLRQEIDAWVSSEALTELVRAEGGGEPNGTLAERLAELDAFSATAWDFRSRAARRTATGYVERNQVAVDLVHGQREDLVLTAARALGLVAARPPIRCEYDHVLVHGGLVRANVWRSAYAAHLVLAGRVRAQSVTALTAHRHLSRNDADPALDEPSLLQAFGLPQREFEAEVMADSLTRAFELDPPLRVRTPEAAGDVRHSQDTRPVAPDLRVGLVAVPKPRGCTRADTVRTLTYWADEIGRPSPGQSILVVTSAISVPSQHAEALRTLGLARGVRVETVGVDHSIVDPAPVRPALRGVHYLQEIRSAVRSYRRLLTELPDA